jgi:hypothetical protein
MRALIAGACARGLRAHGRAEAACHLARSTTARRGCAVAGALWELCKGVPWVWGRTDRPVDRYSAFTSTLGRIEPQGPALSVFHVEHTTVQDGPSQRRRPTPARVVPID